ncbi:DUF523 domain-containing protein [Simiduia agarivorans]|uniref:Uncharacterized protein n=1 Tax=Simiduia agarivorans (strain DSM 21679 / JCM 13881 / BCRC 17597 / SA1) TaxID=1117647 RepID=K4KKV3_SIMAS|nr:DUF523 domain-containing protein [Simiduia agarivorans]AFU99779.1 hypothetical protein M5M_13175 [Simiduia agarivorans SA1 = DSM 21679]
MATRPTLWVSACLLGKPVRYDGGHKHQAGLENWLNSWAHIVPLCPEVFAGLGTPRPPIQRQQTAQGDRLVLAETGEPTAAALPDACQTLVRQQPVPAGAILKARSPSCGAGNSPLFDPHNRLIGHGDGVFVQALKARFEGLAIVDEEQLHTQAQRQAFYRSVMRGIGEAD